MLVRDVTAVVLTTRPRLSGALVAADSFLAHHTGANAEVVVIDDRFGEVAAALAPNVGTSGRIRLRSTPWVAGLFPDGEFERLAAMFDATGLTTYVRPFALLHITQTKPDAVVISLPDDAFVQGTLHRLLAPFSAPLGGDSLVTEPTFAPVAVAISTRLSGLPLDGQLPDAADLERAGWLDQTLFSVAGRSHVFLEDWRQSLQRSPHIGPERLLAEQTPILDQLAHRHAVSIIQDHRYATSYFNADEPGRNLSAVFRFPGFNPQRPWVLSEHTGLLPRVLLSHHPILAAHLATYTDLLNKHDFLDERLCTYGFGELPFGGSISAAMRLAYRRGLLFSEGTDTPEPPNPFRPEQAREFLRWLNEPASLASTVSRFLLALHETRPDLQRLFPDPQTCDAARLRSWAILNGRNEGIPAALLPNDNSRDNDESTTSTSTAPNQTETEAFESVRERAMSHGINVVGLLRGELGVGEAARLLLRAVRASGEPHSVTVDGATAHRQSHALNDLGDPTVNADTNLIALNADALMAFAASPGGSALQGRRNIGFWFWEVEKFAERFAPAFDLVDEVWVASEHVQSAISSSSTKPVHVFPLGATPPPTDLAEAKRVASEILDISPDSFLVAFCFDYASVADRKNPWGAVDAFIQAFPEPNVRLPDGRTPRLILKSINAERAVLDHERLLIAAQHRPDITLFNGYLTSDQNSGLIARADCYLSLHRAEGWGLTLQEAMRAGVPVVATAYSGNLDFMTDDNSWLVPYKLVPIPAEVREYAGCGSWTDPDTSTAASYLRDVAAGGPEVEARAAKGAQTISELIASDAGAQFIRTRIAEIRSEASIMANHDNPTASASDSDTSTSVPTPETGLDTQSETDPFAEILDHHRGLGPVLLPPPPTIPAAPGGLKGTLRTQIERAIQFEIEHRDQRDHQRATSLVEEISATRQAVRDLTVHHRIDRDHAKSERIRQRADQEILTQFAQGTLQHVQDLQTGHNALYEAVREIGTNVHNHEQSLADVHANLARIEDRLDQLTAILEQLAKRPS